MDSVNIPMKLLWYECDNITDTCVISEHRWLGAVKQQAIIWASVDPDLCHHRVSMSHSELKRPHDLQDVTYITAIVHIY